MLFVAVLVSRGDFTATYLTHIYLLERKHLIPLKVQCKSVINYFPSRNTQKLGNCQRSQLLSPIRDITNPCFNIFSQRSTILCDLLRQLKLFTSAIKILSVAPEQLSQWFDSFFKLGARIPHFVQPVGAQGFSAMPHVHNIKLHWLFVNRKQFLKCNTLSGTSNAMRL